MAAFPSSDPPTHVADLPSLIARYGQITRHEMESVVTLSPGLEAFHGMIAYHLGWVDQHFIPDPARSGKSLRPALCLLVAEALGADLKECAAFAAGIELLHNFTLVHDDIQDRSPTRRGRPAVWTLWGEAQAINVGDSLYSLAHQAWLRSPLAERDPAACLAILRALEDTTLGLCEGQHLDISGEGSLELSSDLYLTMIGRKTAGLMGAAAWVGARCAGDDPGRLHQARTFGYEMGLAFQIRDDLLGIWGEEWVTGKSASSDISSRKMTLPVVLALEYGTAQQRAALRARYGGPPADSDDEQVIRALLASAGADSRTTDQEAAHWEAGLRALAALEVSPEWTARLEAFAGGFVARSA
ncbi:MAG TPA: polyprenyl synthetase family protein [Chloroflexota bacterium]|nr:polyprenyl synthetase family protein [Chloroflexota bacterium]